MVILPRSCLPPCEFLAVFRPTQLELARVLHLMTKVADCRCLYNVWLSMDLNFVKDRVTGSWDQSKSTPANLLEQHCLEKLLKVRDFCQLKL